MITVLLALSGYMLGERQNQVCMKSIKGLREEGTSEVHLQEFLRLAGMICGSKAGEGKKFNEERMSKGVNVRKCMTYSGTLFK